MIGLDRRVQHWIVLHRTGWLDPVFEALTWIGTFGAVWIAIALVLALLRGRRGLFLSVVAAVALGQLASIAIKDGVDRHRPLLHAPLPLVHLPESASFPSGHTTTAFAAATVIMLALPRAAAAALVLAAAIGYSRVYVGVHYPLDVLAGAVLGVGSGCAVWFVARRLQASSAASAVSRGSGSSA